MTQWLPVPDGSDFPLENLPFGVVARRRPGSVPTVVVRIGDHVVDLAAAGIEPDLTRRPGLDRLLASGRVSEVRERAGEVIAGPERPEVVMHVDDVDVCRPFEVGDVVDFYSSIHHATNVARVLRPDSPSLPANWRHVPTGYHGRSSSVVVSGSPIPRPSGMLGDGEGPPRFAPTEALDLEVEVGFVVMGQPATGIAPDEADRHVAGAVLLNDWSARDIQAFEYQPLGPFLAKSFATTISPWLVTLDALRPYLVASPPQRPAPAPHLRAERPWAIDLHLRAALDGTEICATNFAGMYWTFAQQLAHLTSNGATTRAGDLFGSGTVSGADAGQWGSLIEATYGGTRPLRLDDGRSRTYLDDGDTVRLTGWCGGGGRPRIGFGEAVGRVESRPGPVR
ncbi:MAG TPA: fumarylacetoacetate hydrolase family protein [Microthrixaceae bacterium]|nr:fumarylacetoacetate hydrolase family protein [Microthrixaceae bacterium]